MPTCFQGESGFEFASAAGDTTETQPGSRDFGVPAPASWGGLRLAEGRSGAAQARKAHARSGGRCTGSHHAIADHHDGNHEVGPGARLLGT